MSSVLYDAEYFAYSHLLYYRDVGSELALVDDGAFDKFVVEFVANAEPAAVVVAGDEEHVVVAVVYTRTHNCSPRVLVHALFLHCLSCSVDGRNREKN